jgi:predicted nucleic acid-binding protein
MRLLDTDVMIGGLCSSDRLVRIARRRRSLGLPGFVAMELICGCRNRTELSELKERLRPFKIYWPREQDLNQALIDLWRYRLSHGLKDSRCL